MSMIAKYILLLTQYIASEISGPQFEAAYLEMFKNEVNILPEDVYDVLNNLFLDVDAYCADPGLRDSEDLGDEDLVASAKEILKRLT